MTTIKNEFAIFWPFSSFRPRMAKNDQDKINLTVFGFHRDNPPALELIYGKDIKSNTVRILVIIE